MQHSGLLPKSYAAATLSRPMLAAVLGGKTPLLLFATQHVTASHITTTCEATSNVHLSTAHPSGRRAHSHCGSCTKRGTLSRLLPPLARLLPPLCQKDTHTALHPGSTILQRCAQTLGPRGLGLKPCSAGIPGIPALQTPKPQGSIPCCTSNPRAPSPDAPG